jgi:hypothetical protein
MLAPPPALPRTLDERRAYEAFYHEHQEANLPQSPEHNDAADDAEDVLSHYAPHLWVKREAACYWIPGSNRDWIGPDIALCEPPGPAPGQRSYRAWEHGRLRLVVEVGSESSESVDQSVKLDRYANSVRPDEILYYGSETGVLRWWYWNGTDYIEVHPDARGWFWCNSARLWFGVEGTRLRIYDPKGNPLGNYDEQCEQALREARRADGAEAAREQAEAAHREEALRRERVEAALREEASLREQAEEEARAVREALEAQRAEFERRLAELEAERSERRG